MTDRVVRRIRLYRWKHRLMFLVTCLHKHVGQRWLESLSWQRVGRFIDVEMVVARHSPHVRFVDLDHKLAWKQQVYEFLSVREAINLGLLLLFSRRDK